MNESDDYDFGSSENKSLASLFGKEHSFEIGSPSLVYKAPTQPSNTSNKEAKAGNKSYYKYIQLHKFVEENKQPLGKYIVGLVTSSSNGSNMLIYQSKKNILIHVPIFAHSLLASDNNNSLILVTNDQKWLLEFGAGDYAEFSSEFSKLGGFIETASVVDASQAPNPISKQKELPILHHASVLTNFNVSESILDPVQDTNDSQKDSSDACNPIERESKKEKGEILARLAKMGLPQLPSFQKEKTLESFPKTSEEVSENFRTMNTICNIKTQSSNTKKDQQLMKVQNDVEPVSGALECEFKESNSSLDHSLAQIHMLNINKQIDPFNLILAENRISNSELRQHMSLLAMKINEINTINKPHEDKTYTQLKSKLRVFQMKSENLEDELSRLKKKFDRLEKANEELLIELANTQREKKITSVNKSEISTQTDNNLLQENPSHFKELLSLIECLPLKMEYLDLTKLKNIKDAVQNEQSSLDIGSTIDILQEKINSQKSQHNSNFSAMRSTFVRGTKKIMHDMYSNISSSISEDSEIQNTFVEQIRNVTSELVRNYDKSIENIGKHS